LIFWGATPVEYYAGYAHFQHQDWLGTERMRTNYAGDTEGTYTSLPFGDGFTASGLDDDSYHFATLDHDYASNTDHAQFRQYSNTQGRWMSPDPYDGSYDFFNPQSLNRYAYAGNNPLSSTDASGLDDCGDFGGCCDPFPDMWCLGDPGDGPGGGGPGGDGGGSGDGGGEVPQVPRIIGHIDLDPNHIMTESLGLPAGTQLPTGGILDIFGIGPGTECEFGACGMGPSALTPGQTVVLGGPIIVTPPQWLLGLFAQFTTATGNALHAPSLKVNSGVCSIYGNQPYLGAGLQCVCQSAGDGPWSQDTRGSLAADQIDGINEYVAHGTSYAGSTVRTQSFPAITLGKSYMGCKRW
jgi:RHS repeat-associated protein